MKHFNAGSLILMLVLFICPETYSIHYVLPDSKEDTLKNVPAETRTYTTQRLSTAKPVIDGKLDDECWKKGNWSGDFTQWIPNEGAQPTKPTEINVQYDDKNLYVAIRAFDDMDKMHRYAGARDEIVGDVTGVNFDSYHDHRTGFEFSVTSFGQQIDLILFNPSNWEVSWNAVWKSKVGMEDSAWVVEYEIPLSQLRYSNEDEQVWGMHVWRWIDRLQEESDWEKQSLTSAGVMYNFGHIYGIKGLPKSRRLEIMPYGLGELNTFARDPENPFTKDGHDWNGKFGFDAKIGVTSNFTLDLTVNPDFGQVESDPSVMNITAFETLYEEKRPFFLEGKTIFNYDFDDVQLFYSRRIGHSPSYTPEAVPGVYADAPQNTTILDAVKLSGKTSNGFSLGFIQSLTAPEYAHLKDNMGTKQRLAIEPMTNYSVLRVQKDYNEGTTTLGGMFTAANRFINDDHLEILGRDAYAGGLDLLHQWNNKKFFVEARLLGSYIDGESQSIRLLQESSARYYQRPGASYLDYDTTKTHLEGQGGKLKIGKGTGHWRYNTAIRWLSPGLELNDLGYMQSSDAIENENNLSYLITQPVSIFRSLSTNLELFNAWNFDGKYTGSGVHFNLTSTFKNNWGFNTNLIGDTKKLDTRVLRGGPDMMLPGQFLTFGETFTDQSKRIYFQLEYSYTKGGNQSATVYELEPGVSVRPFNSVRIKVSSSYESNRNDLQYVNTVQTGSAMRYILGSIDQKTIDLTFRIDYIITPDLSLQFYGSPFVSRGKYKDFKYVTDPENKEFDQRFALYSNPVLNGLSYDLDENGDNLTDYSIVNPDFNFHQFRSNFVIKWKYRPGSYFYFVWSSERTGFTKDANASMGRSFSNLWDVFPGNVFLIKFNYWFSI